MTAHRAERETIEMKTIVKNDRWNGIETVTVWFDDDMSTYEIIDNENGDTIRMIYDGEFLDADEQVDYERLYTAIADEIGKYLRNTTEVEIEEYDEDDETPVNKRHYDVYYTDGVNETYTTLDAETAEEALDVEQIEIDIRNEEEGYEKYRITKVHYAIV